MTVYWLLLLIPLCVCVYRPNRPMGLLQTWIIGIVLTLFIGLRHEVGGDWFGYTSYLERAENLDYFDVIAWGDPGYHSLNWIFASHSLGIYGVNLVCAALFSAGLLYFCRSQPRPWLALCISIPYFVIVVSMGYSRQGVAIGLIMPGLIALERGRLWSFLASVAAAVTFHFTALVMLIFVLPALPGRSVATRVLRFLLLLIVGLALVQTFLLGRVESLYGGYVNSQLQSEGAAIRVGMNFFPSLLLLLFQPRFNFSLQQLRLWRAIAFASLVCTIALLLFPSNSTAIDRISLYMIPVQLVVGSRLPSTNLFGFSSIQITLLLVAICLSVQFIWINYASHSAFWLPYSSLLFL